MRLVRQSNNCIYKTKCFLKDKNIFCRKLNEMAGAKALRHKLNEEFLTCQICLNTYEDPVLLECQHSFCRNCIEKCVTVVSGGLNCPVCRHRTLLPRRQGLSNLRKNFFLQSLIDTLGARRASNASTISLICQDVSSGGAKLIKRRHPLCDACEDEVKAMMRCLDCSDFLCGDCHLVHRQTKFTKNHKMVNLGSLKTGKYSSEIQSRAKIFCSLHGDEVCRMYCENCKVPACHDCIQERCGPHSLIQVKDAVETVKQRSSNLIAVAKQEIKATKDVLTSISDVKSRRRCEKEDLLRQIEIQTKEVVTAAKRRGKNLTEAVKAMFSAHIKTLSKFEKNEGRKLSAIEQAFEDYTVKHDAVTLSGSPEETLSLLNTTEEIENAIASAKQEFSDGNRLTDWIKDDSLIQFKVETYSKSTLEKEISKMCGNLQCDKLFAENSKEAAKYIQNGLVSPNSAETKAVSPVQEASPAYCEISQVDEPGTSSASPDSITAIDEPQYAKIRPRKKRGKAIRKPDKRHNSATDSASLHLDRTYVRSQGLDTSDEYLHDVEADDSAVFFTEDSQDDISPVTSMTRIGQEPSTADNNLLLRPCVPSVRRSRSLASLSAQICGTRPPMPIPKKRNTPNRSASNEILNVHDAQNIMSRPNSLTDANTSGQTSRSTENLDNIARIRNENDRGQTVVSTFAIQGQLCSFASAPKLAVLPNGNIVVADFKAQRIFKFARNGTYSGSFKLIAGGKGLSPAGISITKKGKILVSCGETVRIFSVNGKLSKKFGNTFFQKACGVAVDKKSNKIIVTDTEKSCASIHSADGALEMLFRGGNGIQLSHTDEREELETLKIHTPYFLCVDQRNGNILVSDWANHDVKIFDREGNCLACITSCILPQMSQISSRQKFLNPAGICCDSEGNVFVADHGHNRIAMFNDNWEFQRFVATEQNGLRSPWSLVVDANGKLLVSEYWTKMIKSFIYK